MAKAIKRMANYLGLLDDEEIENNGVQESVAEQPRRGFRGLTSGSTSSESSLPSYMRPADRGSAGVTPVSSSITRPVASATPASMDRIITIHPRIYSDVRSIGEAYRNGQPVIMNLSDVDESECKRLVDFASGLVFGHFGNIERVTSKVFLLTPANVAVSNEVKSAAAQASFFNQS